MEKLIVRIFTSFLTELKLSVEFLMTVRQNKIVCYSKQNLFKCLIFTSALIFFTISFMKTSQKGVIDW